MSEEIKGWKLVPIEPTEEMVKSGQCDYGVVVFAPHQVTSVYRDMLAAAPEPSASPAFWIDPSAVPLSKGADHIYVTDINTDGNTLPIYLGPVREPSASVGMMPVIFTEFDALLGKYWDAAYAEGAKGRTHDTFDCVAARTLAELHRVWRFISESKQSADRQLATVKAKWNVLQESWIESNATLRIELDKAELLKVITEARSLLMQIVGKRYEFIEEVIAKYEKPATKETHDKEVRAKALEDAVRTLQVKQWSSDARDYLGELRRMAAELREEK